MAPDLNGVVEGEIGGNSTKFKNTWLLLAADRMDLDLPDVRAGWDVLKGLLTISKSNTPPVTVLIIPSKFRVAANVKSRNFTHPDLMRIQSASAFEENLVSLLLTFCAENQMDCIDGLDAMISAVESGMQIYDDNVDTHPAPDGYAPYAVLLQERLEW